MKKYAFILLVLISATACKSTWEQEDKDLFYQSCLDEASAWAGTPANAKTYCDCMMEKIQQKYPHVNDALEHMDSVINDPDLHVCKSTIVIDTAAK